MERNGVSLDSNHSIACWSFSISLWSCSLGIPCVLNVSGPCGCVSCSSAAFRSNTVALIGLMRARWSFETFEDNTSVHQGYFFSGRLEHRFFFPYPKMQPDASILSVLLSDSNTSLYVIKTFLRRHSKI